MKILLIASLACLLSSGPLHAAPRLHALFADHAVLQRDTPVPVWGWAAPDEAVTITCAGQIHRTTANARGEWSVTLAAMPAGGPFDLMVEGHGRTAVKDLLFGDVWVCGGQSNMEYGLGHVLNAQEELAKADYPQIRMFTPSPYGRDNMPQADLTGTWTPARPGKVTGSALGYLFAREIHATQKVPVGAIHCAAGATAAEWWMSREAVMAIPELRPKLEEGDRLCDGYASRVEAWQAAYEKAIQSARAAGGPTPLPPSLPEGDPRKDDFKRPTFLFNGMVAPLSRFPVKGVIFYHGESHANPDKAALYPRLFRALIADWRRAWQRTDLPFLYVQLANHRRTPWEPLCEVREAQRQALDIPHTGMAVAIDVGDVGDVHCKNKQEIARRLALIARAQVYGESLEYSGPVVATVTFAERQVRVSFTHADGLCFKNGKSLGLEVAGDDGVYREATGEIKGNTLIVSSPDVAAPTAIRYAWRDTPEVSLYNAAALPAAPFRSEKARAESGVDLFRAGDFGVTEFRIPALGLAADGAVYAAVAGRMKSSDDWGESDIFVKRSVDGGLTWRDHARIDVEFLKRVTPSLDAGGLTLEEARARKVHVAPGAAVPGEKTIDNPTFITDCQRGRTLLLFQLGYRRAFCWDVASPDPPRDITASFEKFRPEYPWKVLAMGPGHGIQLANGRLLVSVWLSDSSAGDHRHSCVSTIFSDDGGQTWSRGAIACNHPEPVNPSEAVLVELADGRVMLNVRNESEQHRRHCLVSSDGISGWQDQGPRGDLFCPVAHASMIRLSGGKQPLLFVNPDSGPDAKSLWGAMLTRRNLTAKLSYDDGATWPVQRTIDDGPWSAYSDLAVMPEGTILCLYERGQVNGVTQAVRLRRFREQWIQGDE